MEKIKKAMDPNFQVKKKNESAAEQFPKGFHLNGHTKGFHPQTQMLEPPFTA